MATGTGREPHRAEDSQREKADGGPTDCAEEQRGSHTTHALLTLQRLTGNRAVARLVDAARRGETTAPTVVQRYVLGPDGEDSRIVAADQRAAERAIRIRTAQDASVARRALQTRDTDVLHVVQDFSGLTAAERLALIRLIHGNMWVGPNDESALERIWRTPGMEEEAARNQALYAESRDRGAELPASVTTFGRFTNRIEQNMTEGVRTVVQGRFDWTLTDRLRVQVGVHFVEDSGVTAPIDQWRGQIDSWWNQFSVVDAAAPATAIPIDFNLVNSASDPRTIRVHQNRVAGRISPEDRADAENYYVTMNPATAPHEFGHLIGLQDEYQRTHRDFQRVTGITPAAGPGNTTGAVAADVATELHTALSGPAAQRAANVQNVCNTYNIVEGDWAQEVMRAYDAAHPDRTLYQAIRHYLAVADRFWISQRFAYATRSVMGLSNDPTATSHSHPVEPRHLREFVAIVRRRFPGRRWQVRHR